MCIHILFIYKFIHVCLWVYVNMLDLMALDLPTADMCSVCVCVHLYMYYAYFLCITEVCMYILCTLLLYNVLCTYTCTCSVSMFCRHMCMYM